MADPRAARAKGGCPGQSLHPVPFVAVSRGSLVGGRAGATPEWVVQDSNLRRHCHQIYSLAPLATWVTTRHRRRTLRARAGGESRTHNPRFTKPMLCRLSYASDRWAVKLPTLATPSRDCKDLCRPPPNSLPHHLPPPPANTTAPGTGSSVLGRSGAVIHATRGRRDLSVEGYPTGVASPRARAPPKNPPAHSRSTSPYRPARVRPPTRTQVASQTPCRAGPR